ncbi:hypothetical protein [uncultured Aliiroseovarius sp.]|uniref:hypothetical protein n=1 Tax=uncultured Aliiroseovarius sp. TaxID=1658783 RepID=UPI00260E6D0E|nr:hypothetical protein [uncultured Aliiroseovarius sp.]
MREDTFLVIGLVVLVLSVPSFLAALREGRAPRIPAILLLIGGGLIAIAITQKPTGYDIEGIPGVFNSVVQRALRFFSA